MKMRILIIALLMLSQRAVRSQTDTLFWFAAPEVSTDWSTFDQPIVLRITTYDAPATVTVSQPAGGGMPVQTVSIAAASMQSIDLTPWLAFIETKPANTVLNYGLKITATAPVTIYYEVVSAQCQCNPEIFVLKGQSALGNSFFIPSQNFVDNNPGYTPVPFSAFDIVATEDNTQITIIPAKAIVGHAAGVPFSITLHKGQSYSATATSGLAANHLMGSQVSSDKPIAITYKDDLLSGNPFGGCADLGGDQIVPINLLGTEYIAVKGFLNPPGDQLFVMATQNNTTVNFNGVPVAVLNAGDTYSTAMGGNSAYIQTSAPAGVLQMSGFGCEIGLSVLPPIVCTGSSTVSFTRSTTESLYVTLLVKAGSEGNFLFNGNAGVITAGMFSAVPGTNGEWLSAQVAFTLGQTPMGTANIISNSTSLFHLGFIHGGASSGCRFGYFSNFAQVLAHAFTLSTDVCAGDDIQLMSDPLPQAAYSWSGPNGFSSDQQNPLIPSADSIHEGIYTLTTTVPGCESDSDEVEIEVHLPVNVNEQVQICQGSSYTLPDGSNAMAEGTYESVLQTAFGCDSIVTTNLSYYPINYSVSGNTAICLGQQTTLQASGGTSYLWQPATGLSNAQSASPSASPTTTTTYQVTITYGNNCTVTDAVTVHVDSLHFEVMTTDPLCNTPGSIAVTNEEGTAPYTYALNGAVQNNPSFNMLSDGSYIVSVQDAAQCTGLLQVSLTAHLFNVQFSAISQPQICEQPGSITLSGVQVSDLPYQVWLNGQPALEPLNGLQAGNYTVSVSDANGCISSQTVVINYSNPAHAHISAEPSSGEPPLVVQFANASMLLSNFYWQLGDGTASTEAAPAHTYIETGHYLVWMTGTENVYGCTDSDSLWIHVAMPFHVFVPNAFTPDGDGVNDYFIPVISGLDERHYMLRIFDRWGTLVFETTDPQRGWTGSMHQGEYFVQNEVYIWQLKARPAGGINDQLYTGHVIMAR